MEIGFNVIYLIAIYTIVYLMWKNLETGSDMVPKVSKMKYYFFLAFFLLALGDTGHVGFRVIAYATGGLEEQALLVGLGSLSTAITIGIFYMIFLEIWRVRFDQPKSNLYYLILGLGLLRLLIFPFPQNQWGSVTPPFTWSLVRNIPLMIQGIAVAILFLKYGLKVQDQVFVQLSLWVFASYLFYLPVILFVRLEPLVGMLMIPKTIAYIIMAYIVLKNYFKQSGERTG